ncbi:MAG: hypothetical protein M3401_17105 [Actinomycetota bacterium]|nr:hypothetical protein [Actinomycetota bacterium]
MKIAVAALVAGLLAAAAVVAFATSGGQPSKPTRSTSPLVSIGQPITPYRAGTPREGWMEMRARNPDGGEAYVVLHHTYRKRGRDHRLLQTCAEVGPESRVREYPVREGGSCTVDDPRLPSEPLGYGFTSAVNQPYVIHGRADEEVERVVISGPGGTYDVPVSRHGAFVIVYSAKVRGKATLTGHLRGGATRFFEIEIPPTFTPPGSVKAKDPGGLPPWTLDAHLRPFGPRTGQTCAQFRQEPETRGRVRRILGESGAPMCGDLRVHPLFADATQYGPRAERGAFSFGPGPRAPKRLIVWGAVSPTVRKVVVDGPGARRELELSQVGRAFITVYPGGTSPEAIAVEATLSDGKVLRYRAPRRLHAQTLKDQPWLVGPRIGLRTDPRDETKLTLSAKVTRPVRRFEITMRGRKVRMRRQGGTDNHPRYVGIYDRTREQGRTFTVGNVYRAIAILCGPEGCSTTSMRMRLR